MPPPPVHTWSCATLLDIDDFVVTRLNRGEAWAEREIGRVDLIVQRVCRDALPTTSAHRREPDEWIVVLRGEDPEPLRLDALALADQLRHSVRSESAFTVTVSVGTVEGGLEQTEQSLSQAVKANERKLVLGGDRILLPDDVAEGDERPIPPRIERELSGHLRDGDRDAVLRLMTEWLARSSELEGVTPAVLRSWIAAEILFAMNVVEQRRLSDGSLDWVEIFGRTSFDELISIASIHEQSYLLLWLERLMNRIVDAGAERRRASHHILALVEGYISEHYAEDLSLAKVAEAVFVSPFYISHLFHRELNTTFLKYLTALRISKARHLLETTSMPVADVATRVGYVTTKNFRSHFKRAVGVTPTEYRRARYAPS